MLLILFLSLGVDSGQTWSNRFGQHSVNSSQRSQLVKPQSTAVNCRVNRWSTTINKRPGKVVSVAKWFTLDF
ncbi:hypothetical protein HanRHA438_Chr06g0279721 [Helianthus annuus]|nr:hypothetical protein HanRHA438_Chr06g0279721 [Helianthus annuus]